jgi:hypothetical protein
LIFQFGFFGNSGDFGNLQIVYSSITFSPTHPPYRGFVANKGSTAIQQACQKAVEATFSRFFDIESRSIFCHTQIATFTF